MRCDWKGETTSSCSDQSVNFETQILKTSTSLLVIWVEYTYIFCFTIKPSNHLFSKTCLTNFEAKGYTLSLCCEHDRIQTLAMSLRQYLVIGIILSCLCIQIATLKPHTMLIEIFMEDHVKRHWRHFGIKPKSRYYLCPLESSWLGPAVIECLNCLSVEDTLHIMVWPGQLHKPK
jgi:hypothetical protein